MLKDELLPELLQHRSTIRIWSAGCYRGQEAYSAAILLNEAAPHQHHTVLGTDRDAWLLAQAEAGGPYTHSDVENLSQAQRAHYLLPDAPPHFVNPSLRQKVIFQQHDLLQDAFDSDLDLILYRNVEPCFSAAVNEALYHKFYAALRCGGVLFVGSVDAGPPSGLFGFQRHRGCLYQKVSPERIAEGKAK